MRREGANRPLAPPASTPTSWLHTAFIRIVLVPDIQRFIIYGKLLWIYCYFSANLPVLQSTLCMTVHQTTQLPYNTEPQITKWDKLELSGESCELYLYITFQNLVNCTRFWKHSAFARTPYPLYIFLTSTVLNCAITLLNLVYSFTQYKVVTWLIYNIYNFVVECYSTLLVNIPELSLIKHVFF